LNLPWIEDTSIGIQEAFIDYCNRVKVAHNKLIPVIQSGDALPLINSVIQGRGFLMVNESLVAEHLNSGQLVKLLNYSTQSPYSLYLVAPEQQFAWNKVKLFEDWVVPKLLESFSSK